MPAEQHPSRWKAWITLLAQVLLALLALWMSFQTDVPWPGRIGLVVLGVGSIAWSILDAQPRPLWRWSVLLGWGLSAFVPTTLLLPFESSVTLEMYLDKYLAVVAWIIPAMLLPAHCAALARPPAARWRVPAFILACFGALLWLATAYLYNHHKAFFPATIALLLLLVLAQAQFHLGDWAIQAANTTGLLLVGLLVVDAFVRPPSTLDTDLLPEKRYYSYEAARRDPAGFARWWKLFGDRFEAMGRDLYIKDPAHQVRFRLKPNGETKLFQSPIRINSRGFRGPEFAQPKAGVYRIVCLGESTTFGCTLTSTDKPWPELLQEKIQSRLKPTRPVEVVNAGIPSFTLENTLARLEPDILPLQPDMLVSYHGYNGFSSLHNSFPSTTSSDPPAYIARPLRLLALVEYRARLILFSNRLTAKLKRDPPSVSNVLDTAYARDYARLIDFARTNNIRLALATHALAVNEHSDPDVVEFYRAGFPAVYWLMAANRLHSALIEKLTSLHPTVRLIHAGQNLDGRHDHFIDLVHLTQEGRELLAENVFAAIKPDLETELRRHPAQPETLVTGKRE